MATLSDIDLSNRTAVLDLEEQELEDINACLDRLILKQTEAVEFSGLDGQDIDEEPETFDRYSLLLDEFQQLKQDMERPLPQRPYGSYK